MRKKIPKFRYHSVIHCSAFEQWYLWYLVDKGRKVWIPGKKDRKQWTMELEKVRIGGCMLPSNGTNLKCTQICFLSQP